MTSLFVAVMILAFIMGLGYAPTGYLSMNSADPWDRFDNSTNVSQDKCGADPWGRELNRSGVSQKEYQDVAWMDDVNVIN